MRACARRDIITVIVAAAVVVVVVVVVITMLVVAGSVTVFVAFLSTPPRRRRCVQVFAGYVDLAERFCRHLGLQRTSTVAKGRGRDEQLEEGDEDVVDHADGGGGSTGISTRGTCYDLICTV